MVTLGTHLSTAATTGDTVIAAVIAVTMSIKSLVGRPRFSTTGTGIVAICSMELMLIVWADFGGECLIQF